MTVLYFNFAVQEVGKVSNRTKYLAATVPISQLESLITSQQIVISNIKYRAEKVIESMTNFLANTSEQKKLSERVLLKNEKVQNTTLLIPALVCESNFDSFNNKKLEVNCKQRTAQYLCTISNEKHTKSTLRTTSME